MPQGVPHSVFLGRVVGPSDPLWLPADQDKALAWMADKAARCVCGTLRSDWDPKQGGRRDAFVAYHETCPGCEAIDSLQEQIHKGGPAHGVRVGLLPPDDPRLTEDDDESEMDEPRA